MDTTDPDIRFDNNGVCHHCHEYDRVVATQVFPGREGEARLGRIVDTIRREGSGKPYDCVIGVSGGVDSTFVAHKVNDLGLRPLAVHLDNGWNTEAAAENIRNAVGRLGIDLETVVLDWEEFRDLQIAFLRASTPDSEIPTDHAIVSVLRVTAERYGIRYIISGFNARTESHLPPAWSQGHYDWRYVRSVHQRFGTVPLRTYPRTPWLAYHRSYFAQARLDLLNYVDYVKADAVGLLQAKLGWQQYGGKHHESVYTRFYQGYILPRKFGYDKRRTHLSSLICSGEVSRQDALCELEKAPYSIELQENDRVEVSRKLGLSGAEFDEIMALPRRMFWDYPSYAKLYRTTAYRALLGTYRFVRGRSRGLNAK
jgi:N-acetyl sugar amidotransferase